MNIIDRRSLLKGITLGAGAVVLQPAIRSLAAEAAGDPARRRIVFFIEGNGTVLDNTLIVYMSDFGDRHHPSYTQWPVVLIGNLGGKLKTNGRFLEYPRYGSQGHKTIGTLYMALLRAVGDRRERFGNVDLALNADSTGEPLTDILA